MEYYGNNDYRDYLVLRHHGILGMKWGKRNGPPYPLGSGDHSASEKKAGWRKSLSGDSTAPKKKKNSSSFISESTSKAKTDSKFDADLANKLAILDAKYVEAHLKANESYQKKDKLSEEKYYKQREEIARQIETLKDEYVSKYGNESEASKKFDKINEYVMDHRNEIESKNTSQTTSAAKLMDSVEKGKSVSKTVLNNPNAKLTKQQAWDLEDYVDHLFYTYTKDGPSEEWTNSQKEQEYYRLRKKLEQYD